MTAMSTSELHPMKTSVIVRCDRCQRRFNEGDAAYEYDVDKIDIKAEVVSRSQAVVWVCEPCWEASGYAK